jgi:hypothetical protein
VLRERWRILGPPVSPCMGEALNHPLLRYRALLRGRGLFAANVDLVQRGVEHVRRDVEFVGCVGAEPVVVGGGKHFLPDRARFQLELLDERRLTSGVVYLRYRTQT